MKLFIPIQSFTDLITNSSSETFIIEDDRTFEVLFDLIEEGCSQFWPTNWEEYWDMPNEERYKRYDGISGDGGTLEFYENDRGIEVYIDENRHKSIEWIKNNFKVIANW